MSLVAYHANMESLLNRVTILGRSLSAESAPFEITGVVETVADAGSELESLEDVAQVLPRSENSDLMIRVKLKRKLTYKGHYQYQFVHPEKVKTALTYLKEHKFYSDVEFNNDWINPLSKTPEAEKHDDVYEENTESTCEDDSIDDTLHDRQQHGMFMATCLQPVDIAQEVLDQHFEGIISVAPGETNNPVRLLCDE
ncbi:hypothetical protein SRHO_G00101250 [Serrasalmus rhombeus]